jgi:hypothetical protein
MAVADGSGRRWQAVGNDLGSDGEGGGVDDG